MSLLFFEVVNYLLAFFFWMILGRLALGIISGGRRTLFTGVFEKATAPAVYVVRKFTPASVSDVHIPILSLPLLFALRILLAPLGQPTP